MLCFHVYARARNSTHSSKRLPMLPLETEKVIKQNSDQVLQLDQWSTVILHDVFERKKNKTNSVRHKNNNKRYTNTLIHSHTYKRLENKSHKFCVKLILVPCASKYTALDLMLGVFCVSGARNNTCLPDIWQSLE